MCSTPTKAHSALTIADERVSFFTEEESRPDAIEPIVPTEDESSPQSSLDKALHLLRTTVNGYSEIINESIRGDVNEAYNELKDGCLAVQTIENESRHTAQQIIASAEQEAKGIIEGADLVAKQREEHHQQLVAERNKSIKRYNEAVFVLQNTIKLQGAEYSEAAQNKHIVNLCKSIKGCHKVLVQNATISSTRAEQARLSHEDFKTKYDSLLIKYNAEAIWSTEMKAKYTSLLEIQYETLTREHAELHREHQDSISSSTQTIEELRSSLAKLTDEKKLLVEDGKQQKLDLDRLRQREIHAQVDNDRCLQLTKELDVARHALTDVKASEIDLESQIDGYKNTLDRMSREHSETLAQSIEKHREVAQQRDPASCIR